MSRPTIDAEAAASLRDGFSLPSTRAAALRPLALAPYDELRGLCLDLETRALPDEHVLLAALAGFLTREGCYYAAHTCLVAECYPDEHRPDLYGLFVRLSAFQRYLRDLAGVTDEEARADDDHQADPFRITETGTNGGMPEANRVTRAEAYERFPDLAALLQEERLERVTFTLGGTVIVVEPVTVDEPATVEVPATADEPVATCSASAPGPGPTPTFEIRFIARIEPMCSVHVEAESEEAAEARLRELWRVPDADGQSYAQEAHRQAQETYHNAGPFAEIDEVFEINECDPDSILYHSNRS